MYFTALLLVIVGLFSTFANARTSFRGYSGAPGHQTCASSCHGQAGGNVTVSGFPEAYTPSQSYLITIQRTSGNSINQFNGSVRAGTGSTNAGVITAGTGTEVYNVTGETNGVHLSSSNQTSATFNWTAPAAGTGTVQLYVGAYQGTSYSSGLNTTIVQVSDEAMSLPGPATNPNPADGAGGVLPEAVLSWTAGSGAVAHAIYFGMTSPPDLVTIQVATSFDPPGSLLPGTTYYWRVDERNAVGVTSGDVWRFTTLPLPEAATNPTPADGAIDVPRSTALSWTAGSGAEVHHIRLGPSSPPPIIDSTIATVYQFMELLLPDTQYFWRIDEENGAGITEGTRWSFRTEVASSTGDRDALAPQEFSLGPVYPNPFNARLTVPFVLPKSADVILTLWDVTGRQTAVLADGYFNSGAHRVEWSAAGVGSGIYFLRLSAGGQTVAAKVVALK
ncbi:T9SS type A sorting domain-containing protein [bacterium]|nr:T9SS type A sorting domain-containing protein [bacterium]